ncbi:hypothetical protein BSLG_009575 [Batrachochytrium salamandrivorans]|nr:hypothetical protein BSLG_009575 [Batrachochytrium salamandrivorans]
MENIRDDGREDTDNAEGREHKRYLERKNKSARQKLKKEDNSRVGKFVEQAFTLDPRIRKFKEEERYAKDAKRREREELAKANELLAARKPKRSALPVRLLRQKKAAQQAEKATRELAKNAVRKEKKTIKRMLRDYDNFLAKDASPDAVIHQTESIEYIFNHSEVEHLKSFRIRLEEALPSGIDALMLTFDEEHMLAQERDVSTQASSDSKNEPAKGANDEAKATSQEWTPKEVVILIKAVKMFPGGASSRWEKIAEYERARRSRWRNPRAKDSAPAAADRNRFQAAAAKPTTKIEIKDAPSQSIEPLPKPQQQHLLPLQSTEQQLALEQAMRKFPASAFTANPAGRWEKMADDVPGKSKNEIKARVKELANMVKKKKTSK